MRQLIAILVCLMLTGFLACINYGLFEAHGVDILGVGIFGFFDTGILFLIWGAGYPSMAEK